MLLIPHLEWSFDMQNLDQFISSTDNRPIDNATLGRTLEHLIDIASLNPVMVETYIATCQDLLDAAQQAVPVES